MCLHRLGGGGVEGAGVNNFGAPRVLVPPLSAVSRRLLSGLLPEKLENKAGREGGDAGGRYK